MSSTLTNLIRKIVLGEDEYTKTDGSQRDIQMSQPVVEALTKQYEVTGKLSDYVFCNLMGAPLDNKNFTDRVWYPLLRHLGMTERRPYPALHAWERDVAVAAALVAPCGLAGYLHDHPDRDPALSLNSEEREEIVARRLVILDAPLRRLRSRDAECGSTLGAVLDVSGDEELDRQQVARITAAIGFMAIL